MSYLVLCCSCVFSPFSIAFTSLGEERSSRGAFPTFVRFVLVWFCLFPFPLGVWEGLRFVIVAFPWLFFSLTPFYMWRFFFFFFLFFFFFFFFLFVCFFVVFFLSSLLSLVPLEGPSSIASTSLGEERANFSAFRTFVRFVLVWICRFPLPLGVWEGLRFVIVHSLDFFLTFFVVMAFFCIPLLNCFLITFLHTEHFLKRDLL